MKRILKTDTSSATIIIRLMVGVVFLSEGIQKFLFAESLGAGRFANIGLTNPEFLGPFVGSFEILCGTLVLVGLLTRLAYQACDHSTDLHHVGGHGYHQGRYLCQ